MQWDTRQRPEFAICRVSFDSPGEQIVLEASAMVARDTNITMKTGVRGGLLKGVKRLVSGESLFQNVFTASKAGESIWFAPGADGDMEEIILDGSQEMMLSSSAFVATVPTVTLDTKFSGVKGFFGKTGLFLIRCSGTGPLWFNGFGALHRVDIEPGQTYIVDNGHIVGFTGGLTFKVKTLGGLGTFLVGGEALVCEFSGHGSVWISTRSANALAGFLYPFRPVNSN